MCFPIWNYDLERVQVFQFTQSTLINPIVEALSDEEIEIEPGHRFQPLPQRKDGKGKTLHRHTCHRQATEQGSQGNYRC